MLSIRERIPVGIYEEILGEIFEEILGEVSEKKFEFKFPKEIQKESLKNFLIDAVSFFGQRFRRWILHPRAFQLFSKNLVNWVLPLLVLHKLPRFYVTFWCHRCKRESDRRWHMSKLTKQRMLLCHFWHIWLWSQVWRQNTLEKFLINRFSGSSDGVSGRTSEKISGGICEDLFLLLNFWRVPKLFPKKSLVEFLKLLMKTISK